MWLKSCLFLFCFSSIFARPVDDNAESKSTEKKMEELLETVEGINAKSGAESIPINDEEIEDGLIYKSVTQSTLTEHKQLVNIENSSDEGPKSGLVDTTMADDSKDLILDEDIRSGKNEDHDASFEELSVTKPNDLKSGHQDHQFSEADDVSSESYTSEFDKNGNTKETQEDISEDKDSKTGQQVPQDEDGPLLLETRRVMTGETEQDEIEKSGDEHSNVKTADDLEQDSEAVNSRFGGFPTNLDFYRDVPQPATSNPLPPALIFRHNNPFLVNRVRSNEANHPDLENHHAKYNRFSNIYGNQFHTRRTDNIQNVFPIGNHQNQFGKSGEREANEDFPQEVYVPKKISDYENTNANNYIYVPNQFNRRAFSPDVLSSSENLLYKKLAQASGFPVPSKETKTPKITDQNNHHGFGVRNFSLHPYHTHRHNFFLGSTPSHLSQFN